MYKQTTIIITLIAVATIVNSIPNVFAAEDLSIYKAKCGYNSDWPIELSMMMFVKINGPAPPSEWADQGDAKMFTCLNTVKIQQGSSELISKLGDAKLNDQRND